ncbi:MAG: hypothetical protein ABWX90_03985 [Candidatus Saccharimonadales bacterium]
MTKNYADEPIFIGEENGVLWVHSHKNFCVYVFERRDVNVLRGIDALKATLNNWSLAARDCIPYMGITLGDETLHGTPLSENR